MLVKAPRQSIPPGVVAQLKVCFSLLLAAQDQSVVLLTRAHMHGLLQAAAIIQGVANSRGEFSFDLSDETVGPPEAQTLS